MPATRVTDYLLFLKDLGASGADYFLEGGQAVNFWAEYFSAKGAGEMLEPFQPFTSKDCDVWAGYNALKYLRSKQEGGRLIEGASPADGQVGVFALDGTPKMAVDIMTNVYGVPQARLKQLVERSLEIQGIRVIDPIFLFLSKCHCLLGLDQADRQDEKHLEMLRLLVPEHLKGLLDEAVAARLSQRALINELKLLQTILKTSRVKRALQQIGSGPVELIPIKQLEKCGLLKVERFAKTAYGTE
jgi:hypothetical protein